MDIILLYLVNSMCKVYIERVVTLWLFYFDPLENVGFFFIKWCAEVYDPNRTEGAYMIGVGMSKDLSTFIHII